MPLKTFAIATVILGSVMAPTAAGASIALPPDNVQVVSQWSHPQPGSPVDVIANYQAYEQLASAEPDLWGGAYVDGDSLVIKYVGQTQSEASAKLQNAGVVRGFRLAGASVTTADLQDAQTAADGVLKDDPGAVSWGPDYANSGLIVSTTSVDAATLDALRAVISTKVPVSVVENAVHPITASRYYDTVPYYGGDLIRLTSTSGAWKYCSTGFILTGSSDGYAYAVSAGHCYQEESTTTYPDVAVMRSSPDRPSGMATVWTVSTTSTGTSSGRHGDLAIYRYTPISGISNSALGAGTVFVGNGDTTSALNVKSTSDLPQNYQSSNIRTSGASGYSSGLSTGEISPDWISLVEQTLVYTDSFRLTNMTIAEDAYECISHGDSGGAVYLNVSGGVSAVGIISGSNYEGAGFTNCRNYYTPVKYIYFGGTIKTQ